MILYFIIIFLNLFLIYHKQIHSIYNPYKFVNLYFTLYRDLLNLIHLKIFWVEFWSIHVDGRQENGLHLIVSQFIGWCVGGNQHLENQSTESTERNFCSIIKVLIVLKKFKRNMVLSTFCFVSEHAINRYQVLDQSIPFKWKKL